MDGNKRTAVAAAIAFLRVNHVRFPEDWAMIDVANKHLDKPGLAGVLRRLVEGQAG